MIIINDNEFIITDGAGAPTVAYNRAAAHYAACLADLKVAQKTAAITHDNDADALEADAALQFADSQLCEAGSEWAKIAEAAGLPAPALGNAGT